MIKDTNLSIVVKKEDGFKPIIEQNASNSITASFKAE